MEHFLIGLVALSPMFIMLKVFIKVPYGIVLKVVSRSEKGPLSESGVHFAKGATL
jgi:hypothetical protein